MISVSNLVKIYPGNCIALDGISFSIESGEICGYLGANGAGKTTTVKILTGMLSADSGEVIINGIDVTKNPQKVKQIVGYVPESGAVFQSLSPYEFLEFVCKIYGMDDKSYRKRIYDFLELFDLRAVSHAPMASFSKGMRQKVLIMSSLIHNPDVIFWDEPLSGLDYNTSVLVRDLIRELSADGKTFFYCSHVLDVVEKTCSRIIIIKSGRTVFDEKVGTGSDSFSLEEVYRKYIDADSKREKISSLLKG
jgi:ABC-2 type transport system ATP-binding protein